jgi:glycosyltransferase involved in cell wall biosynthesis
MTRDIFFLKDSGINDWLLNGFEQRNYPVKFIGMLSPRKNSSRSRLGRIINLHYRYIHCSYSGIKQSKENDIIICFLDVMGLYLYLLTKVLFRRREILVINIMFNEGSDFITRIKKSLYRWMLKRDHLYPTVTSPELNMKYRSLFRLTNKEFFLLHDCYGDIKKTDVHSGEEKPYVFCGGSNGRDWVTISRVASILSDIEFIIVGPKGNSLGNNRPNNVRYYYNISESGFNGLLRRSSIIALPLNTEAPAGLIVLFTAGLMSKPVITTNNYTMREYIEQGVSGILVEMGDYENFALEISKLFNDQHMKRVLGTNLCTKVEKLGSPDVYVDTLISITQHMN